MKVKIQSAEPVLSWKSVRGGFGRYVKHWRVTGNTLDESCGCPDGAFTVTVECHQLEISENELSKLVIEKLNSDK